MPLRAEPFTIEGGCNCRAVRYKIDIPALSSRPFYPAGGAEKNIRTPTIVTDHCNDCRQATGSFLPAWILTPISMISASCVTRSDSTDKPKCDVDQPVWIPATKVFTPSTASENTFLSFDESSEGRRRTFCGRCGTNLSYAIFPALEGWTEMLDMVFGTLDRKYLEDKSLAPERQLWWDYGIDWIKSFSSEGADNVAKHPSYEVDKLA